MTVRLKRWKKYRKMPERKRGFIGTREGRPKKARP